MFPFARLAIDLWLYRNKPLAPFGTHRTTHWIRPSDIDMFAELNNGRTMTLYDIGRITLAYRIGLMRVLRREGWGLTIAGSSVRYRRRVRMFNRVETRARTLGWDDRFIYLEHSMWRGDACTSHVLIRSAVTDANGIVSPERVRVAMSLTDPVPSLPDWARAWIEAESQRPWPPQM